MRHPRSPSRRTTYNPPRIERGEPKEERHMASRKSSLLLASAVAGMLAFNAFAASPAAAEEVKCVGANKCKGTGECGGKGHSCAGQNACKGQGWQKMDKDACVKAGGKVEEKKG
jgi:uncharacterized membrane protein